MAGTIISYQGFRAQSCLHRLSRGYDSDASWVVFVVSSFPEGFDFQPPPVGETLAAGDLQIPDFASIRAIQPAGTQAPSPSGRLASSGTLVMAESQDREWKVVAYPLWVSRIEQVRKSERGPAIVKVHLVDVRAFWTHRGFLRRWSFNRSRADGTTALDSVKPDGSLSTLAEIATQVVAQLPRTPGAVVPDAWKRVTSVREFTRLCPAVSALGELVREKRLVDPCLRRDGTVALHPLGEGFVGYAEGGEGANKLELPYDIRPSKNGTAQGHAIDSTYPDDFVVVAGGERVGTQIMDGWPAVLVLPKSVRSAGDGGQDAGPGPDAPIRFEGEGDVVEITEASIRKLTDDRFGLAWLNVFVLDPPAFQNAHGLPRPVVQLLREQAYRRFRMPGVVLDAPNAQGRLTGPNAHVLPLLPRAETIDGRRLPVLVETFRFGTEHRTLSGAGGKEKNELDSARKQMALLRDRGQAARRDVGVSITNGKDFDQLTASELLGENAGELALGSNTELLARRGVSVQDVQGALDRLRTAKQLDGLGVGGYAEALKAEAQALDKLNGSHEVELLAIAKKVLDAQDQLKTQFEGNLFDAFENFRVFVQQDSRAAAVRQTLADSIQEDLRAIARADQGAEQRTQSGVASVDLLDPQLVVYVRNYVRSPDPGARVHSAELGIVETSTLAGWVDRPGAPAADACVFVPKPVQVTFGATVRPRLDVVPGGDGRTAGDHQTQVAGAPGTPLKGADLADEVTWFTRAFRRAGDHPELIDVREVPPGDGLVVPKPSWIELVPLDGVGNTGKLHDDAVAIAVERLTQPAVISAQEITIARPWPVNPDGIVASVEIRSRDKPLPGTGFETVITTGGTTAPPVNTQQTRLRPPPQQGNGDGARREGLR